ncbi:MAG: hypothetical protein ACLT3D_10980 [Lawsonibacter sp.]
MSLLDLEHRAVPDVRGRSGRLLRRPRPRPSGWPPSSPTSRRSTTTAKSRDIDIIKLNGSIELAPILGLSDVIVDIVETGKTLLENHLAPLETIVDISAWLISSRVSYQFKHQEIAAMQAALARKL